MSTTPGIGHNSRVVAPEILEDARKTVEKFESAAADWRAILKLHGGEIVGEAEAEKMNDFIAGLRKAYKTTDDTRKKEKAFYDDQAKEVQKLFAPLLTAIQKITDEMKAPLGAYVERKAEEERERKAAALKAAQEAAAEALRLSQAAEERGDYVGAAQAEEAAKAAAKAEKQAAKPVKTNIGSFTGGGRTAAIRTTRFAKVMNWNVAFMQVATHPRVREAILSALNENIRAKDFSGEIPGVQIVEERKIA